MFGIIKIMKVQNQVLITTGLICLLLFSFDLRLLGQSCDPYNISKKFYWTIKLNQDSLNDYSFEFENQNSRDNKTNLPVWVSEIPLTAWSPADSISIEATDIQYTVCPEKEQVFLKNKNLSKWITNRVVYSQKAPILQVTILPFCFEGDVVKKITSIQLKIKHYKSGSPQLKTKAQQYAGQSLLSEGKWVKIKVTRTGIYKIPYSQLSDWGFSDPASVNIFGFGGKMLPKANSLTRGDDMVENAAYHYNNAIYFYAQGPVEWSYNTSKKMFTHQLHDYADGAYYFLSERGTDSRVSNANTSELQPTNELNTFDDYRYYESEKYNLIRSGRTWYGERFDITASNALTIYNSFPNIDLAYQVRLSTEVASRSEVASFFYTYLNENETSIQNISFPGFNTTNNDADYAYAKAQTTSFTADNSNLNLTLVYETNSSQASGYLDKIDLQAKSQLVYNGSQFNFRNMASVSPNAITRFKIKQASGTNLTIWDVTNNTQPVSINYSKQGDTISFEYPTTDIKEFVIFSKDESFPVPQFVENVTNQNLHGLPQVDYLIIANQKFLAEANKLAYLHQVYSNLTTAVVTPEQIYNEFSSGQPDVTAIRMFAKMFYDRAGNDLTQAPKYLLLFGDGSYDNRSTENNSNYILTYQSLNSVHYTQSYVTDDYFGVLDDFEGENIITDVVDIGIGRFPVQSVEEAQTAVNKVEQYLLNQTKSPWKTRITFVGDDGDGNTHMNDADALARKVAYSNPEFEISKIYFDAYKKVTQSNGKKYPDVEYAIDKAITDGTLIFNYSGHGGEKGLAHEQVVTIEKIKSWTNIDKLALFITATCEFSRFDDKDFTSAGEEVFLNPKGGGFGLFTTTRLVYSSLNKEINSNFYTFAFNRDGNGDKLRLGDILIDTKRITYDHINKLNFTLLGDPALQLAYPSQNVSLIQINGKDLANADTLKALSKANLISAIDNDNSFNGSATTKLYDKMVHITTLGNEGTTFEFDTYENVLFRGETTVNSGSFSNTFIVPKDIKYNIGYGRVSYYAQSEEGEAFGANNKVSIGGSATIHPDSIDYEGPQITLFLNNKDFSNGGVVGPTPLLHAALWDKNGINTSGNGIGHDITLSVDNNSSIYILNNYFKSVSGSYQYGDVIYQLPELATGNHTLAFKAWDTYNNSSEVVIRCTVSESGELNIVETKFYPNPLKSSETLYFSVEHDDPNAAIKATLRLYGINGQKLMETTQQIFSNGVSTIPIEIVPALPNGQLLNKGIYLLRINLESESGKKTSICEKLMVIE